MFRNKCTRIKVDRLYVNQHAIDMFHERKTKKVTEFVLPKEINIALLPQRSKNNREVEMKVLRGAITLKNNLVMLVNMYEKDNKIVAKALSVLTIKQIKGSYNFGCGEHLLRGFLCETPEIKYEEKFFDDSYEDYLSKVEWAETDVHLL